MSDIEQTNECQSTAIKISIVGLGGAGSNIVGRLQLDNFSELSTVAINTDAQALESTDCLEKLLVGSSITRGLGTGGELEIGKSALEADRNKIVPLLEGMDLIVLVAGLGGGTGSAAITMLAEMLFPEDALVLAFVTTPFSFEGTRRKQIAEACLGELRKQVHGLITLPNDILLQEGEENTSVLNAFAIADRWVGQGIHSLCTLLLENGLINQDLSSLRSVFCARGGKTVFGTGVAEGSNFVKEAMDNLFDCPLLHAGNRLKQLDRILINLIVSPDISLSTINEIIRSLAQRFGSRDDIVFGAVIDEARSESLEICVLGKTEMEFSSIVESESSLTVFKDTAGLESQPAIIQGTTPRSRSVHQSKLLSGKNNKEDSTQDEFVFNQVDEQRGYFEKTERNEYQGEDLDVPTYLRRGIRIKLKG